MVEVDKKYIIGFFAALLILGGTFFVVSYGTGSPAIFGHTASEIEGLDAIGGSPDLCVCIRTKHFDGSSNERCTSSLDQWTGEISSVIVVGAQVKLKAC